VTLVCPESLQSLLRGVPYIHHFITGSTREPIADIAVTDYHLFTSLRALATHLCRTMAEIPNRPYITRRLNPWGDHIGICTRAGEEKFPRRHRSLSPEQRARIVSHPASWIELDREGSWNATRYILSTLEMVITVDTGVAHLAGAMGIPCWVILPGISASYYGVRGPHCPFYPTHRLFRNGGEGIDTSVNLVCEALAQL
jgi:hypothetical protein